MKSILFFILFLLCATSAFAIAPNRGQPLFSVRVMQKTVLKNAHLNNLASRCKRGKTSHILCKSRTPRVMRGLEPIPMPMFQVITKKVPM